MKTRSTALWLTVGATALTLACAPAAETEDPAPETAAQEEAPESPPHWTYEGQTGPAAWGGLSAEFSACAEGMQQSPIDITGALAETLPELRAQFGEVALRIVHAEHVADAINNGHTIQVNYTEGDMLSVDDTDYELVQYHFHSPSEHTVEGAHFPMEMHFVHAAADGALAVIGVFIEEGEHNDAFDPIWNNLPQEQGVENHIGEVTVDVDQLLPANATSYRYAGSLTTPPCSEGVAWIVMTEPIQLSGEQIGAFTALIEGNNRPVQPLNGRPIVTDQVENS
ncbi:MAG: hypothetical protein GKS06_11425 [Acidobacteria bacterium]|nr:hypothetical protein [Acidobacteriota bacterium]